MGRLLTIGKLSRRLFFQCAYGSVSVSHDCNTATVCRQSVEDEPYFRNLKLTVSVKYLLFSLLGREEVQ